MSGRRIKRRAWIGYLIFFLITLFIATAAIVVYIAISKDGTDQGTVVGAMIGIILALAGLCTGIDVWRRKHFVDKPVDDILSATDKIATGDFSVRLPVRHESDKYDEFDVISENLNKMAEALSHNEVLKTDFVSNVSHEIKTPLSVISNYAMLLQDESLTDETKGEYTKNLVGAVKRLNDLVMNILKLNKLENQGLAEHTEQLHLGDFLGDIILGYEDIMEQKQIELDCDIDDITLSADKTYMEIICNNLFSNAIKFTDNGGKISVALKQEQKEVVLSVADTGCGMNESTIKHIFDKFYQGDSSHSAQGNGLGLALVKKAADITGAEILVKSAPGEGSTFTVKFKNYEA